MPKHKKETQPVNETWPVCIILQKKKNYQKNLQKLTEKLVPGPFVFANN